MKLHRDHRPQPSADLPPAQQTVTRTRDVEGYSAEEARRLLHVSDGNQRVLVHRERPRVRSVLERHLDG
jgi:DNA-directed RNA polymerase specialized sigma24 family protein